MIQLMILGFLAACTNALDFRPYNETALRMFNDEDKNNDTVLSKNETVASFLVFDFDGDGRIERSEYACYQLSNHEELGSFAHALFDEYDFNNDSVLELADIHHFYDQMDTSGNGLVEQTEFVTFWIGIFIKHEHYLLEGTVHPLHDPRICDHVNIPFNFHPYDKYAEMMFAGEDSNADGILTLAESLKGFEDYDTDGDGVTSRIEYACYMRDIHPNLVNFAHAIFDEYDVDQNDIVNNHDLEVFYAKMDTNGDAQVSQDEFVTFWEQLFVKTEKYHMHGHHHHANAHTCPHHHGHN